MGGRQIIIEIDGFPMSNRLNDFNMQLYNSVSVRFVVVSQLREDFKITNEQIFFLRFFDSPMNGKNGRGN